MELLSNIFSGIMDCRQKTINEAGPSVLRQGFQGKNTINFSGTVSSEIDENNVRQLAIINLSGR